MHYPDQDYKYVMDLIWKYFDLFNSKYPNKYTGPSVRQYFYQWPHGERCSFIIYIALQNRCRVKALISAGPDKVEKWPEIKEYFDGNALAQCGDYVYILGCFLQLLAVPYKHVHLYSEKNEEHLAVEFSQDGLWSFLDPTNLFWQNGPYEPYGPVSLEQIAKTPWSLEAWTKQHSPFYRRFGMQHDFWKFFHHWTYGKVINPETRYANCCP